MFVRFRQTACRLQASLVETRRVDGKVRHEHIAGLGSVEMPPSVEGRITFWQRLHERLAKLANRVDAATQAKILGAIHARIPMVTMDEQHTLKLESAEAEERFWTSIYNMHAGTVEDCKGLATTVERAVAEGQAGIANATEKRNIAKARRERLERGEDVQGGLGKPVTREDLERELLKAGFTKRDLRRLDLIGAVKEFGPEAMEVFRRSLTSTSQLLEREVERKAREAIEYFCLCDDPVAAAKEMLEAMSPKHRGTR